MASTSSKILAAAVGRRKTATASVRLVSGKGAVTVNGKPAKDYFTNLIGATSYSKPLQTVGLDKKYDVSAKVSGGGLTGQLDAVILGISRALVIVSEKHKTTLRTQGLLTRDPRERQRRQVGTGGKARRQKQSPKR
jgi:small subunit ribosomal protein S9